ncbi:MAG: DMT family transporter [Candidatus Lokiarchaeota archaeon]|nr:DMT family transporter [Candidatus Lokiarchaeota archaeon]
MVNNLKKGLIFGVIGTILVGFQPIIANSAKTIDPHAFSAMTCLIEAIIFLPIMLLEMRMIKKKVRINNSSLSEISLIGSLRKNVWLLLLIGIIFGINQLLFFVGYKLAGEINGSLTQKTSVFFGLLYGFLLLKEKISRIQIVFSIVLFFGLVIAITQGSFNFFSLKADILIGLLIVLLITAMWMFGHTMTKPLFSKKEVTPIQMVFIRNILSGFILLTTFVIFSPVGLIVFYNPLNWFFFILMGTVYGIGLFCWYKTLSYLDVSNATIVLSPTPIVTAIFATFILGAVFTVFHLIGSAIVILSVIIIVKQKRD